MKQSSFHHAAVAAAKKAGACLREQFARAPLRAYTYKDSHNVVSGADLAAEAIILDFLRSRFPDHAFFGEEKGWEDIRSDYVWVVDALDGTTNFTRKIPYFCVSIALVHKKVPLLGVVYQPLTEELFVGERHRGAMLNGKKIEAGGEDRIERAVINMSRGATREEKIRHGLAFETCARQVRSIRILGSSALELCAVGCGRMDAFVAHGVQFYDIAAASLIAQEGGALIRDFQGKPWKFCVNERSDFVATHRKLVRPLVSLMRSI